MSNNLAWPCRLHEEGLELRGVKIMPDS